MHTFAKSLIAAATVGLSAATPNPKRMAFQMACEIGRASCRERV